MRNLLVLTMAILLAACGANKAPAMNGCDAAVTRVVAFTAPGARDTVEARAFGADCASAVVVWTVRAADGKPLWTHATPYAWVHAPSDPVSRAEMEKFLGGWSAVAVDTTASSPEWAVDADERPIAWGAGGSTMFTRETYEQIRAAGLPRICVPTTTDTSECIFYDKDAEAVDVHYAGAL